LPEKIYVADASIRKQSEVRDAFADAPGRWPRAWILWSGQIYSFTDPADSLLSRVCVGRISAFPSADWAYGSDEDQRRRFVWLLKAALIDQMRPALRASKELTWVAAPDELPLVISIPGTSNTRALVKAYFRDDGSARYVRHLAFRPAFVCLAGQWYLELTPTYHFTRDGREPAFSAASHRSGIKRRERHSDFRRNVDTLARLVRGDVDLGGLAPDPEHQLLQFGALAEVRLDTGANDQYEVDDEVDVDGEEDESGDRSAA
jgi:hypothetical protein